MSNNLSKYRRGCGLSQVALAGRSKVSAAYLALLEQSGRTPGIAVAKALGKALGRPAEQVFPSLRLPHPGINRFQQLALAHPGPAGELTAAQKAMVKDVLPLMPGHLFKGALRAEWKTAWVTIEAFGAWVKKFPAAAPKAARSKAPARKAAAKLRGHDEKASGRRKERNRGHDKKH